MTMFEFLSDAKVDPILSLMKTFQQDPRKHKLDLGIGVYKNAQGITPIMESVKNAQLQLAEQQNTKSYVGLAGNEGFNESLLNLVLNNTCARSRSIAVQTPGASGALRVLADLIYLSKPNATVWISDPSYVNHRPIMEAVGLKVKTYSYFDSETKGIHIETMLTELANAGPDDVVLLHACCHNPTGADLAKDDWDKLLLLAQKNGFIPFIDLAYQGFGEGIEEDLYGVRLFADNLDEALITVSCSKSFGLYRERTGAAMIVAKTMDDANKAKGNFLKLTRSSYTMPPDHGAAIVEMILNNEALNQAWRLELDGMRQRLISLRFSLAKEFQQQLGHSDFDFVTQHKGMFSMLGINREQVNVLREKHGVYIVEDGRINIAGLNEASIAYLVNAIKDVK